MFLHLLAGWTTIDTSKLAYFPWVAKLYTELYFWQVILFTVHHGVTLVQFRNNILLLLALGMESVVPSALSWCMRVGNSQIECWLYLWLCHDTIQVLSATFCNIWCRVMSPSNIWILLVTSKSNERFYVNSWIFLINKPCLQFGLYFISIACLHYV